MRPDEHKSKESKRYQAKKLKQGDATAAEIAGARKIAAAKSRDKGTGIAAIRRRNGEALPQSQIDEQRERSILFARRKLGTNADRYKEVSAEDEITQDAELGIDRETTELVGLLEETDDTAAGASYFKFKEEQVWDTQTTEEQEEVYRTMMQVDFDSFEGILQQTDTRTLLGLSEKDIGLVDCVFEQEPITVTKPIVPAVTKNSKGLVLFKSLIITEPKKEVDGIYLRNDGSNHRSATNNPKAALVDSTKDTGKVQLRAIEFDLDELLALDTPKVTGFVLPKPGATRMSKMAAQTTEPTEDEAWLDDILG
ncbi:hypothetical protein F4703DRAFT_1744763 [Phycomyces blakesleeanus]